MMIIEDNFVRIQQVHLKQLKTTSKLIYNIRATVLIMPYNLDIANQKSIQKRLEHTEIYSWIY